MKGILSFVKMPVGQNALGAKCPWGKMSLGQNVFVAKCLLANHDNDNEVLSNCAGNSKRSGDEERKRKSEQLDLVAR